MVMRVGCHEKRSLPGTAVYTIKAVRPRVTMWKTILPLNTFWCVFPKKSQNYLPRFNRHPVVSIGIPGQPQVTSCKTQVSSDVGLLSCSAGTQVIE